MVKIQHWKARELYTTTLVSFVEVSPIGQRRCRLIKNATSF
jgi:hypothetical protein